MKSGEEKCPNNRFLFQQQDILQLPVLLLPWVPQKRLLVRSPRLMALHYEKKISSGITAIHPTSAIEGSIYMYVQESFELLWSSTSVSRRCCGDNSLILYIYISTFLPINKCLFAIKSQYSSYRIFLLGDVKKLDTMRLKNQTMISSKSFTFPCAVKILAGLNNIMTTG